MTDPLAHLQAQDRFLVRQHYTAMVNRYDVTTWTDDGTAGELLATCQQARMKLREEVVFFADQARQQRLWSVKAQQALDVRSRADVLDAYGATIGSLRKGFGASLLRSTWYLSQPALGESRGQERSVPFAVARRIWEIIPFTEMVPLVWPYHFDFATGDGRRVMSVERRRGVRDTYRVVVSDPALDRRLAASMAVALDAFQNR